jgi:dephospho-CoA kinase
MMDRRMSRDQGSAGYVVGLTGGIGTGKPSVCRLLADCGATVISSDQVPAVVYPRGWPEP